MMITAEAHPGRTDAQGGHLDYKNKSGLGSYHYHCGDHEAHLHPNGVCPYKNGAVSNENTSGQTQTQTQTQSALCIRPSRMRLSCNHRHVRDSRERCRQHHAG